ncbi:MAG: hypothetical protein ACU0FH_08695 [Heliomarina sp.]|uniref:hypothetical protein n=1 Tax=Heliomarina sp. TaxID=2917556 RepID=UPI0040594506
MGPRELFIGAVAVILAHEMHHLRQGPAPLGHGDRRQALQEGRLAQLAWACDDPVDDRVVRARDYEARADEHAAKLLSNIPSRPQPPD